MPAGPRLARRTTLALAAGLVVLAGCDDDGDRPDGAAAPTAEPDPDVALVDGVVAELARVERVASAAGADDLVALHQAHLEALDATPATGSPTGSATGSPTGSPTHDDAVDLRRREHALQAHLVEAAVAARSGALAALLASMSAAQSQVLTETTVSR